MPKLRRSWLPVTAWLLLIAGCVSATSTVTAQDESGTAKKTTKVKLDDSSPAKLYSSFCTAITKKQFETAAKCLSEKGTIRMLDASMNARKIVERLADGPFPESLSKKEAEKLRDWSDALAEHYEAFEVGITVNANQAQQILNKLEEKQKREFIAGFLKVYTSKAAPKAFRDRMKTLWYSGRLKARNRVVQQDGIAKLEAAVRAKTQIEFSPIEVEGKDPVWRLDGVAE